MKLYRNAIILVIIVALLGTAYFLIGKHKAAGNNNTAENSSSTSSIKLTNYTTDDVDSVTLKEPKETFVIVKNGTEWKLSSPTDINADPSALSGTVIEATSIIGDKVVEQNAKDLTKYGLDNPVLVTLKLKGGKEKTIEFGNLTPTKGGYYAKVSGENKVYVVGSYSGDKLVIGRNALKSKTLFTFGTDGINKLSMERAGKNVFSSVLNADKTWDMTQPIKGSVNSTAVTPMLQALAGTSIKDFVEDNSDLSKYGLDHPSYEFDFSTTTAGAFKLLLGDETSDQSAMYAKLDGSNDVFTIDSTNYTFLDKPLKEITDVFAYIVNIDKINTIDLTMDGKTTHMTLDVYKDKNGKQDADKDKFTVDGKDASGKDKDDNQPFRAFYESLIGISLDDVDLNGHPAGTPEVTIKYALKSGETMKVDFISKDSDYYYVMRNGEYAGILVSKSKDEFGITGMKKSYKKMMDFLAQQK